MRIRHYETIFGMNALHIKYKIFNLFVRSGKAYGKI